MARRGMVASFGDDTGQAMPGHMTIGNPIYASPLMHQGILYIGSGDGLVYALDAVSGVERWRVPTEGWVHSSSALL